MDPFDALCYRVLVVDRDPAAFRHLNDPESGSPFRVRWVPSCDRMPSGQELSSCHLVLIAEECLAERDVQRWGAGLNGNGVRVLAGRNRGGGMDLPHWIHGIVRRPYDPLEVQAHAVRALCRHSQALDAAVDEGALADAERTLAARQVELEHLQRRLEEGRQALSLMAERRDAEGREAMRSVREAVRSRLLPVIRRMEADPAAAEAARELEEISACALQGIGRPDSLEGRMISRLSSTELRIAILIRLGIPGRDIARRLGISTATVQTHRKNIRKKLGIRGKAYSLGNLLGQRPRGRGRSRTLASKRQPEQGGVQSP